MRALRRWRSWALQALGVAAVLLAVHFWQTRHMTTGTAPAVEFERALTPGARQTLAQWQAAHPGEPLALYFWATWCPVCKAEQPLIDALVHRQPVLPVALQSGPGAAVAAYEQRHGLRWNSAVDEHGALARAFGVQATPSLVIIAPDGRIASRTVGLTSPWGIALRLWWARLTA